MPEADSLSEKDAVCVPDCDIDELVVVDSVVEDVSVTETELDIDADAVELLLHVTDAEVDPVDVRLDVSDTLVESVTVFVVEVLSDGLKVPEGDTLTVGDEL